MEKARQPGKTLLNTLRYNDHFSAGPVHLKPLSPYCRPAGGTHEGSLALFRDIPSPFSQMVVRNIPLKRILDDSCLDNSIETPAKKPYIPSTASPDLGLGCDSFNVVTPETVSRQGLLERQEDIRRQTEDALAGVKSHLNLSSSSETSDGSPPNDIVSKTNSRPLSPYTVTRGNVFDFNIDNILCLSPITCDAGPAPGATNNVKGCLCHRSHGPLTRPSDTLALNPTAGQQMGAGESNSGAAAVQVNDGHLSHGPVQFLREVSGSSQPLLKPRKLRKVHAASLKGNQDLKEVLGTISAPSGPSRAEALEVKVKTGCGAPLFESTICESEEAHTVESSFEDSLPLEVQVRSVVVVGNRHASWKTAPALSPISQCLSIVGGIGTVRSGSIWILSPDIPRRILVQPQICLYYEDHGLTENTLGSGTAMTELLHLRGSLGETLGDQWQHPSDLTTRNHQKRFGYMRPTISLAEWKAQSSRTRQGFSMVPQISEESSR